MLHFDVITLFPGMFAGPMNESMIRIAQEKKRISLAVHDLRTYAHDRHKTCDDTPFGGGAGMVMKPEPLFEAIEAVKKKRTSAKVILLSPRGKPFDQQMAKQFSRRRAMILVCGHYEGVDERVIDEMVDEQVSIGDYVLTGGELAAMCIIDAVTRLLPGVLGNSESTANESFQKGLLEYPQYTRPREYRGLTVPEALLSGNHKAIAEWRHEQAVKITKKKRPDLLK